MERRARTPATGSIHLIRSFIRRSWDGRKPRRWLLCRSSDRTPEAISSWVRSTRHVLNLVHELEAKGAALTQLGHRVLLSSWSDVDIREIQAHVALHLPLLQATLARWATGARIGRALTTLSVNRPPPGTRSSLVSCAQNAR